MKSYLTGASARLAMLKREHGEKWRTWVRFNVNPESIGQGMNGRDAVWYTQSGAEFRNETFADDVEGARIEHRGWFTDPEEQSETARGIVAGLSHGRFIAGYLLSMNDERVYFSEVFDNAKDAARMADEHARIIGEQESEHAARFQDAMRIESSIETALHRLRECIALRHVDCMSYARSEARELVETIRNARETLARDFVGVL